MDEKSNFSLLQNTYLRLIGIQGLENPLIICNEEQRFLVAEQMRELNIDDFIIILEPFGRNTAPAITIAAIKSLELEEDPTLLVLSSDHEIKNVEKFLTILNEGSKYADQNKLVTFGIIPNSPEIGYGYIKASKPFSNNIEGFAIESFLEKPDVNTAKKLIKDNRYTWNSGMFVFKAKEIIKEINKFTPDIFFSCKKALSNSVLDLDFQRLDEKAMENCPSMSIDIAVMEKTN